MHINGNETYSIFFSFKEFGDSARARKLYEQDTDSDDDDELETNPKLEQGKRESGFLFLDINSFVRFFNFKR